MINFNLPKNTSKRYKILKTAYFKPIYDENFKMVNRDVLICTIKDIDTNETILRVFPEPVIDYYVVKHREDFLYPRIEVDEKEVKKKTCLYRERDKSILITLGLWEEASKIKKINYQEYRNFINENVKNSPYLYSSDTNIEDFYKTQFELEYGSYENCPLKKSYFDIEVDVSKEDSTPNDPRTEITAISYFIEETKTMYGLMLKLPDNPGQKSVMRNVKNFIMEFLLVDSEMKNEDINIDIRFYDDEPSLIRSFFEIFHEEKCDTLTGWNVSFDIKYILNRAMRLGMDVARLVCTPSIPDEFKRIYFYEDPERIKKGAKKWHRLWDWMDMSNYTMVIDQMSLYSNLRKRYEQQSYSLYAISKLELDYTKVELQKYGLTIRNAHILNYPIFLKYSLTDTFLLYLLERKSSDLNRFIATCDNTRISKGINISIIIKNILFLEGLKENRILGNNIDYSIWNSIPGALVASPNNIDIRNSQVGEVLKTLVFDDCIDMDASSEYPSVMREWNICKNTIRKRFTVICNALTKNVLMSGEDLFKALQTLDSSLTDLCEKIFNLPPITDIIDMFDNYLIQNKI